MNRGRTLFAQLLEFAPIKEFQVCVARYPGRYRVRTFSAWDQFLAMAFAQLTYRESLRDIEVCLAAVPQKLYHMGFRSQVRRSTLADANEGRDWRIFAEFAQVLVAEARSLYIDEPIGLEEIDEKELKVFALDSTTVDLCLSVFPWARFRSTKSGIKMHTLLDLQGSIPVFMAITNASHADVRILDELVPVPGAIYVLDRGYVDFRRLFRLHEAKAVFVTRAKKGMRWRRVYSRAVDRSTGLVCDQTISLAHGISAEAYPERLRRVRYRDPETGKHLTFLTNDFTFAATTIVGLYRLRWKVELFFKWIKQHLRIKTFFGESPNAVKTQIWVAVAVYLLVAIARKRLRIEASLYTMLQILSMHAFEKQPLSQQLFDSGVAVDSDDFRNQLSLFNL
jgi:hypothetical protein